MEHVLVRYAEIGTKSRAVQGRMLATLRDRVAERLAYEDVDADVARIEGRIHVALAGPSGGADATAAAAALSELPGVASTSPAIRTDPSIDGIAAATDRLAVGATFGVDARTAGDQPVTSDEVNVEVGAHVEAHTGASVDLDDPETWIGVDVRDEGAFVFAERYEGPGGFPVGTQDPVAALISGGIDSPVAAYEVMTRGADVVPIYFYNRPYAAGDHRVRFEAALSRLRRMHPGRDWYYHCVDMNDVNEALFEVGTGRMVLHRIVLFRTAARIAADEGARALVTGEAIGQKSSQTLANLERTSRAVSMPVLRPLLTRPKEEIVERARRLGTFEDAVVDSACRTIAPKHPATALSRERLSALEAAVDVDSLVDRAYEATERVSLPALDPPPVEG